MLPGVDIAQLEEAGRHWLDTVVHAHLADEGRTLARRRQASSAPYRRDSGVAAGAA